MIASTSVKPHGTGIASSSGAIESRPYSERINIAKSAILGIDLD